jgi:XTP/dITP diphosphohydrolase
MTPAPTLIFATNNAHKVDEIRAVLPENLSIITLKEAGIDRDIPEPHDTLEANAVEKARVIHALTGMDCFSEDTGLEVEVLNGAPGVRSARYAGEGRSASDNTLLLLANLRGHENRRARFRTVICLILGGREHQFEGICPGHITLAPSGAKGFGYDPVFIPEGAEKTFADMSLSEKSAYSHRSKATAALVAFLREHAASGK